MSKSNTKRFQHSTTYLLVRGDEEFELEIEYDIDPYDPGVTSGRPEICYPPEGGCVTDMIQTLDGKPFEITDAEDEEITRHIERTHDHSYDPGDYYERDEWDD